MPGRHRAPPPSGGAPNPKQPLGAGGRSASDDGALHELPERSVYRQKNNPRGSVIVTVGTAALTYLVKKALDWLVEAMS